MKENEFRTLDNNNYTDRLMEAWIMWAKTAIELSDIIDTLYKQYKVLDDPKMMKQMIEMAYQAKKDRVDNESINNMKDFIKNNILIEGENE